MFKRVLYISPLNITLYEFVREVGKERLEEMDRQEERGIGRKADK
jgi:hypothetical protein